MFQYNYRFKVRYKDIDQMGVMYYSRYFEYYESARTDMMRSLGLTYKELEAQGTMMPVVHAESDYKAGPGFDDHLICTTEIREIHRNRMEIHYRIVNEQEPEKVLNRGMTIHAFMKPSGKPTRIPEVLMSLLKQKGLGS